MYLSLRSVHFSWRQPPHVITCRLRYVQNAVYNNSMLKLSRQNKRDTKLVVGAEANSAIYAARVIHACCTDVIMTSCIVINCIRFLPVVLSVVLQNVTSNSCNFNARSGCGWMSKLRQAVALLGPYLCFR